MNLEPGTLNLNEMETELLKGFLKQAEGHLPTIRSGILVCAQEGNLYGELNTALWEIESIKSAAAIIGFDDIVETGTKLEKKLKKLVGKKEPLSDDEARWLLDKLTELEAILAHIHFSMDDPLEDVGDFIEESFENLQINHPPKESVKVIESFETLIESEETEEEFEIDDEMLEIFTLEAEDIVRSINANLEILGKSPENREALLEIRRNAHTLKGSAGIVGLKQLSDLAHRVEDLLDYLAENEIESNENIFELLLSSTDCFAALGSGENSAQLTKKIALTYKSFDKIMATLLANGTAAEIDSQEITTNVEEISDTELNPKSQFPNHKSVVRVSLEKLDDLVNIVSGLIISRSVFEQRLAEFGRQIKELHHSTHRLQRSTGKLETDFEANMLQVRSPNSNVQGLAFSFENLPSTLRNLQSFDALEFDRYTEFHQTTRELIETTTDTSSISSELHTLKDNLDLLFDNQRRLIEDMQDKLLRLRMVSFGSLSTRLQRTVRVICDEEEKSADLFIEGEKLEIDTQILDSLIEPLLHLLRNAVAHGVEPPETRRMLGKSETGKISLRLISEGTHIFLTISDDGRGISASALKEKAVNNGLISQADADAMSDSEAFELAFLPGLTTAEKLSQVSGRGVGLNIVKNGIVRQQGTISIDSEPQRGTTFTIRLPMALAVTRALLVRVKQQTFAFPLKLVKQITDVSAKDLSKDKKSLQLGDINYQVSHLNQLLNISIEASSNKDHIPLLLLDTLETPSALIVDEIIKTEEIVIKPLGKPLNDLSELLGATIMGDGNIVPVLDLVYLLKAKLQIAKPKSQSPADNETAHLHSELPTQQPETEKLIPLVMIVDDSPSVRHLTSNIIKNAGWTAMIAKDGLEALEILQDLGKLPDIILTDVEMPRMDGYELLASLKRHETLQTIPVVMITSRTSEKHHLKAIELGVSEYLTKPFEDKKLLGLVQSLTNQII